MFLPWAGHICQELGIPSHCIPLTCPHWLRPGGSWSIIRPSPDCKAECTNSAPWALPSSPESNEERTVTRWDLGELWAPMWQLWSTHWCFMICLEILNSLYPPYAAPTKPIYIVSSDYTFSLGSWHLDSSYLSYFDPNATCPLPLRLSSMSHLKFTVFTTYPRYFPPLDSSKNAHIFSFMHIIHPIKY